MRQVLRWDSTTAVGDGNGDGVSARLRADLYFTLLGGANRIHDEVGQHTFHLRAVHLYSRKIEWRINREIQSFRLDLGPQFVNRCIDQISGFDWFKDGLALTCLNTRKVEQVAHQLLQTLTVFTTS